MKYKILVSQYFDTYHEWTKVFGEVDSLEKAKELELQAFRQYRNRPLVSYSIRIREDKGEF